MVSGLNSGLSGKRSDAYRGFITVFVATEHRSNRLSLVEFICFARPVWNAALKSCR